MFFDPNAPLSPPNVILSRVAPPVAEPVSLADAKAHIRLEVSADDAYVAALITAAREYVEKVAWRALMTQTWVLTMDDFPGSDIIELPKGNLLSVNTVQYRDADNLLTTLPTSFYEVDQVSVPGRVILKMNQSWPGTSGRWNAVQIAYDVGFGPTPADVPEAVKQAIKILVSQMYEQRTPEVNGTVVNQVKFTFDALMAPYRLMRFA